MIKVKPKECKAYINKYNTVFFDCKYQSEYQNYLGTTQMYIDDVNYCPKCGSKLIKEVKEGAL